MVFAIGYSHQAIRAFRARWLLTFCFAAIGVCFARLSHLQIIRGRYLSQVSENNHTQVLVERAPRGRILDRNGEVLADDQPVFVALFSPLGLAPTDIPAMVSRLASILEVPSTELERRVHAASRVKSMVRISDKLTREKAFQILQSRLHLPGISLTVEEQRYYPKGALASHVLGYVGQITDAELEQFADQGYQIGDWIGKLGLERLYDPTLHGQDGGFLIEVDVHGRQVRVLRHILPQAGKDLVLTLDHRLQSLAEARLKETKHAGAAIVMNPQTGELLAIASAPGYNPNLFLPLGDSEERKQLLVDPAKPLFNRAIQALYPPGSTFKIVTAFAGFENHAIDPKKRIYCDGSFTYGKENRIFHCWRLHGHGAVDYRRAMAESCDVFFYQLGDAIGPSAIEETAKQFGFGQVTGVDLPHEKKWLLPMAWKQTRPRASERYWHGGETLNYSIGQGALQVTPLQMASLMSTVANGGSIWQPYLVAESRRFGSAPEKLGGSHLLNRLSFSEDSWHLVRQSLSDVVQGGTGIAAQIRGVEVAGKTGTAQVPKGKEHAWFIAYAPAEQPTVACSIVVEHGGHGGSTAAPIAHDLLAMALGHEETNASGEDRGD